MSIKLSPELQKKWIHNTISFLKPLFVFYLIQVIATLSVEGHAFYLHDLLPTRITVGAMFLYLFNTAYDYLLKYKKNEMYK